MMLLVLGLGVPGLAPAEERAPLPPCREMPDRPPVGTEPNAPSTPDELEGRTLEQVNARLGPPFCRSGNAYQWLLPQPCMDPEVRITAWLDDGVVRAVHTKQLRP